MEKIDQLSERVYPCKLTNVIRQAHNMLHPWLYKGFNSETPLHVLLLCGII